MKVQLDTSNCNLNSEVRTVGGNVLDTENRIGSGVGTNFGGDKSKTVFLSIIRR